MQNAVNADLDGYAPLWRSFAEFFYAQDDADADFLLAPASDRRGTWTRAQWKATVAHTARLLRDEGIGAGDAVATALGNSAEALITAYAGWTIGACLVPLNPADAPQRKADILADSGVKLLVCDEESFPDAAALIAGFDGRVWRRHQVAVDVPDLPGDAPVEPSLGLDRPALLVYTSGTTGDPKGVQITARSMLIDCDAIAERLQWDADTRIITVLPIHHVNGLIISSLLPWFQRWSTVLQPRFDAQGFWQSVRETEATACSVVPTVMELLLRAEVEPTLRLREVLCGAGPLLPATVSAFEDRFGIPVRHLYGLSETTAVATMMPRVADAERRSWYTRYGFPSIGSAVAHVEVRVADDEGRPVAAGERGEIEVRGATVMQGYAGKPAATAAVFRGRWFRTGDEGFWHPGPGGERFFFVAGRIKEVIIRGGANISPVEVDAALAGFPGLEHALTFGFAHSVFGEEVAVYVVADAGIDPVELARHARSILPYERAPKVLVFGDSVPFTATGKPKRKQLEAEMASALSAYREYRFSTDPEETVILHLRPGSLAEPASSDRNDREVDAP